jgi:hypothetical protein
MGMPVLGFYWTYPPTTDDEGAHAMYSNSGAAAGAAGAGGTGVLAATGATSSLWLLALAVGLVVLGALVLRATRTPRHQDLVAPVVVSGRTAARRPSSSD